VIVSESENESKRQRGEWRTGGDESEVGAVALGLGEMG
jgi:hypothetical protein